ncbi:hypothetical protein CCR75_004613 [Bremia lactucae]|uniref:Uncharacterized protein n=1 Tax=Bremia lactucae TaxID=4779 RepID=A0A976ILX6_BRELC|nr:hypothetical protein CCR75_004613 [Bremia lactucae]
MSGTDKDHDWIVDDKNHVEFVLNEVSKLLGTKSARGTNELEYSGRDVIYRRAAVGTQFMTSCVGSQNVFEANSFKNVVMASHAASCKDLDDEMSSSDLRQNKTEDLNFDAAKDAASTSQFFIPTEEVPDAQEVNYHQVNPMFESSEPADVVFFTLYEAMQALDIKFSCGPDWTVHLCCDLYSILKLKRIVIDVIAKMDAYAVIAAEELSFKVLLQRLAIKSTICVDFILISGDELKFLGLTDSIRKSCRSIDKDMTGIPDLRFLLIIILLTRCSAALVTSFDIMADWSMPRELSPGSLPVNLQELAMLLVDIDLKSSSSTRYEAAKRLKELCHYDSNRRALVDQLKEQFIMGLQAMLKDDNENIVRFAIFIILNFADDATTLNNFELPWLPETLRGIVAVSQKESTKQLADDLFKTINAIC